MAVAKITRQGLTTIAVLVVLLWSCILAEHWIIHQANLEAFRALRENHQLRMRYYSEPVSVPAPIMPQRPRPVVG